jgi:fluoride exporter
MKKFICIGFGGAIGAIIRFLIEHIQMSNFRGHIPLNTLAINIGGSFMLALIFTTSYEVYQKNENIKLGITTGFLGAFTTFSTMCKETVMLINKGYFYSAIFYIVFSAILGLGAAYLGNIAAKGIDYKLAFRKDDSVETASDFDLEERNEK